MERTGNTERERRKAIAMVVLVLPFLLGIGASRPKQSVSGGQCIMETGASLTPERELDAVERCLARKRARRIPVTLRETAHRIAERVEREEAAVVAERRSELETEELYRQITARAKRRARSESKLLAGEPIESKRIDAGTGSIAVSIGTDGPVKARHRSEATRERHATEAVGNRESLREAKHEALAYHSIRNGYIPDDQSSQSPLFRHETRPDHHTRTTAQNQSKSTTRDTAQTGTGLIKTDLSRAQRAQSSIAQSYGNNHTGSAGRNQTETEASAKRTQHITQSYSHGRKQTRTTR